ATGDACCGPEDGGHAHQDEHSVDDEYDHGDGAEVRPPWWRDTALLPSAIAGVTLLVGYVFEWTGVPIPALVFQRIALLAG
ncbi:hypothetical protein ACO1KS_14315, partial [Staphylococcus aureus]